MFIYRESDFGENLGSIDLGLEKLMSVDGAWVLIEHEVPGLNQRGV